MADYEAAAYSSLEKLKEKHDQEINLLRENIMTKYNIKYTLSKELMELRAFEKKFFALKQYDKAEQYKKKADVMEAEERRALEN